MSVERYLTIEDAALELAKLITDDAELRQDMRSAGITEDSFSTMKDGVIETRQKQFNSQLMNAAIRGEIAVRHPQTNMPFVPETRRTFYELVSVAELNSWLDKNKVSYRLSPEIEMRTQAEQTQLQRGTSKIGVTGIDRNQVINAFKVQNDYEKNFRFWDDKLGRPPNWLKHALVQVGKRGVSSMWDPLIIGCCLLDKNYMTLPQLDSAIYKSFPELLGDWKEQTRDRR